MTVLGPGATCCKTANCDIDCGFTKSDIPDELAPDLSQLPPPDLQVIDPDSDADHAPDSDDDTNDEDAK